MPAEEFENDFELDYFQSSLLKLLDSNLPEEQIIQQLKADPKLAQFRDYIASWEPQMVDLARRLTHKWGRKPD